MTTRLAGEIALVTGAGSGIGRGIAQRFALEGASVLGVDRSEAGVAETAAGLDDAARARFAPLILDVSAEDAPTRAFAECRSLFGEATILVNNAGIGDGHPAHSTEDDELDRVLDINLRAVFRFSREAVRVMRAVRRGSIVNIASVYGLHGAMRSSAYSATKAGVVGLTRQMATDYGRDGLRINAIAPGYILTPLTREFVENDYFRERMVEAAPLARVGTPEDIAGAAVFLSSADASFVTGAVLQVDGGWAASKFPPPSYETD
jgi:NAD(P)-dependent dehydrogenase (short-subunit alcohol dehydrogenase family)